MPDKPVNKAGSSPKGGNLITLDDLVVEGKLQKPEVFYVMGRAESKYVPPVDEQDFLKEIIDSVKNNPF